MITLYSTGCPQCQVLKAKLAKANINYNMITDIEVMKEKGFDSVPMLDVDGQIMTFVEANNWLNGVMKNGY